MLNSLKNIFNLSAGVRRFIATEALLGIGVGIFQLVLNLYLLDIKLNEQQIGELTSIGALLMGLVSIPAGLLASWAGRKKIVVAGVVMMGLGYIGFGLGSSLAVLYAAQVVQTIGSTLLINSEIQLLYHYSRTQKEEVRAFSLLFAIFTLFVGIGTLLGGLLPEWFGGHTSGYRGALFFAAGVMLLGALLRGILLPQEPKPAAADKPVKPRSDAHRQSVARQRNWPSRAAWTLSVFTLLAGLAFGFTQPYLNVIVKFRMGWADTSVSLLLTAVGIFTFIGSMLMPVLLERLGINRAFLYVFTTNIILTVLLFAAFPPILFSALLLVRGGGFTLLSNMMESQAMSCIHESERNLFAGMRTVFRSVGSAAASFAAGLILAEKNYTFPFLLAAVIIAVGYAFFLLQVRPLFQARADKGRYHSV